MKDVTREIVDFALKKTAGDAPFRDGKAIEIVRQIDIYLGGRLPAELADIINQLGGKADPIDRLVDLLTAARKVIFKELKVKPSQGTFEIASGSPLIQYEVEHDMARKKVNATPAEEPAKRTRKKRTNVAAESEAAAPVRRGRGRSSTMPEKIALGEPVEKGVMGSFYALISKSRKKTHDRNDLISMVVSDYTSPRGGKVDEKYAYDYLKKMLDAGHLTAA